MDSIRASEAPDAGSIPAEATNKKAVINFSITYSFFIFLAAHLSKNG
jgi:hypothetical protein